MDFQSKNLSVLAYANGFTLWHYRTQDDIDMIDGQLKYFPDGIIKLMNVGDMILIHSKSHMYMRCIEEISNGEMYLGMIQ